MKRAWIHAPRKMEKIVVSWSMVRGPSPSHHFPRMNRFVLNVKISFIPSRPVKSPGPVVVGVWKWSKSWMQLRGRYNETGWNQQYNARKLLSLRLTLHVEPQSKDSVLLPPPGS